MIDLKKAFILNRTTRMWERVKPLLDKTSNKNDKKLKEYIDEFFKLKKKIVFFSVIRGICFFFLYFSVISGLTGNLYFIGNIISYFAVISSVIGTTIFGIGVIITTKYIDIFVSDAHVVLNFIIKIIDE
ncbi:MAG: hypothetical protein ACOCP4_07410 [Candidatus Woesearchaeota archaeon]